MMLLDAAVSSCEAVVWRTLVCAALPRAVARAAEKCFHCRCSLWIAYSCRDACDSNNGVARCSGMCVPRVLARQLLQDRVCISDICVSANEEWIFSCACTFSLRIDWLRVTSCLCEICVFSCLGELCVFSCLGELCVFSCLGELSCLMSRWGYVSIFALEIIRFVTCSKDHYVGTIGSRGWFLKINTRGVRLHYILNSISDRTIFLFLYMTSCACGNVRNASEFSSLRGRVLLSRMRSQHTKPWSSNSKWNVRRS